MAEQWEFSRSRSQQIDKYLGGSDLNIKVCEKIPRDYVDLGGGAKLVRAGEKS